MYNNIICFFHNVIVLIAHCFKQKYNFLFNYFKFCFMIGKIYIKGLIGTIDDEIGVELIDVISQVRKQPEATSFNVYINSEGGVVQTGYDIYNFIKSLGVPITTIGQELVASMGTVIFMAGQKRIVEPDTKFMIHLPMGGIEYATADEMENHAKLIRDIENQSINFYSKELSLSKEAITPLLKNETWLTEQQLVDLGFVTSTSEMKLTARITNIKPKIKKMTKKSKLRTILNAIIGETVNKTIYTADEKELVFPDLDEDGVIEIGAKATLDGMPAEGEIVSQDGTTYTFVGGILESIKEKESDVEEEVTEEEMIEALIQTLEIASNLEERVSAMETETVAIKKERDEFKTKLATATATIAKLKGSSEPPAPDVKDKDRKETVSSVVANWRKNKQIKKK